MLHPKRGFFRPAGPGRLEIVLAHPLGIVEATDGVLTYRLDMAMRDIELTRHLQAELTRVQPGGRTDGDRAT